MSVPHTIYTLKSNYVSDTPYTLSQVTMSVMHTVYTLTSNYVSDIHSHKQLCQWHTIYTLTSNYVSDTHHIHSHKHLCQWYTLTSNYVSDTRHIHSQATMSVTHTVYTHKQYWRENKKILSPHKLTLNGENKIFLACTLTYTNGKSKIWHFPPHLQVHSERERGKQLTWWDDNLPFYFVWLVWQRNWLISLADLSPSVVWIGQCHGGRCSQTAWQTSGQCHGGRCSQTLRQTNGQCHIGQCSQFPR